MRYLLQYGLFRANVLKPFQCAREGRLSMHTSPPLKAMIMLPASRNTILYACVYRLPPIVALITACLLSSVSAAAKEVFPSRPLDRAQVLVWMDFGESTQRVEKLISRAGIDFQPATDYLDLVKTLAPPPSFLMPSVSCGRSAQRPAIPPNSRQRSVNCPPA